MIIINNINIIAIKNFSFVSYYNINIQAETWRIDAAEAGLIL